LPPAFRQAGGGRIINLAAMEALFPKDGCGAQAIAGGAVIALSRSLAVELGPQGIAVNTIVPGPLSQDWPAGRDDAARGRLVGRVALRRLAEADDIAAAIMILADPALNFTTGFTLVADGGYSLQTGPGMPY
jgi:3-oxoacyl-[acyl-carrier protein] reductase